MSDIERVEEGKDGNWCAGVYAAEKYVMKPITTNQRACLKRAAAIIEKKANELNTYYRCSTTLRWDHPSTGLQYAEHMRIAKRLRGMVESKDITPMNPADNEVIGAARSQISPLGNAACILGYFSTQTEDKRIARRMFAAARRADEACSLLNKVVYKDAVRANAELRASVDNYTKRKRNGARR